MRLLPASQRLCLPELAFTVLCVIALCYLVSLSWVADDAFITLRVVDNFSHGFGLRWNVDERVQVYTHPLWLLLQIPFYQLTHNVFLMSAALSAALGITAVGLLFKARPAPALDKILLVLLPLTLCSTFSHFISCGLETPLSICLAAVFFYQLERKPHAIGALFFTASLLLLTRFDHVFIIAPSLAWLLLKHKNSIKLKSLLLAISPVIAWCLFSLLYYGFVLPNTKYAKLNAGIALSEYLAQGLHYYARLANADTLAFLWIAAALYIALHAYRKQGVNPSVLTGAGIAAYLLYILLVGGDFMAFRLFAVPFFLSVWLVFLSLPALSARNASMLFATGIAALAYQQAMSHHYTTAIKVHGIADEYQVYAAHNGLFLPGTYTLRAESSHPWAEKGRLANSGTDMAFGVGMYGYYAGAQLKIIDQYAITDPLLARLPHTGSHWRIGHIEREIPRGYMLARQTGDLSQMPDGLRDYYQKLRIITSGALLDTERLRTILAFQLGQHDHLLQYYQSQRGN